MELEFYLFLGYCIVMFLVTNILAKRYVKQFNGRLKRRFVIPIGGLVCIALLFLVAALIPDWIGFAFVIPFICFYVGLVAHITFDRVAGYNKQAADMAATRVKK